VGVVAAVLLPDGSGEHKAGPSSSSPSGRAKTTTAARKAAGAPTSAHITKKVYGKAWPFIHVTAGTVRCILRPGGFNAVTFTADGGPTWALNGIALDMKVPDIPKREWRKDPAVPGAWVSIAPLRDPVAKACGL
jgi:hypothetical protein